MIFHDLEALITKTGLEDKYILTRVVASRARQFCEKKSSTLDDMTSGRCINQAIRDLEDDNLTLIFPRGETPERQEDGGNDPLEG